jgi:hypothetical protein
MPYILGDIHTITATFLTDDTGFHDASLVIIGGHTDFSLQYHKSLVLIRMVMYGDESTWFQRIEKTVAFILQTLMEVIVLP